MVCFQYARNDGPPYIVHARDTRFVDTFTAALLDDNLIFIGHNIAFDMAVVAAQFPRLLPLIFAAYQKGRVLCTQVRERLRAIAAGAYLPAMKFGLADLAAKYGDTKDASDPWRLRYGELMDVPVSSWPPEAVQYAEHDVVATRVVFLGQGPPEPNDFVETRHAFWLHLAGLWGVVTDPARVERLDRRIARQYERYARVLRNRGWVRADGSRDTKAVAAYMVETYGDATPRTEKGAVSLDADTAELLGDRWLRAYGRYGSLGNIRSKDLPAFRMGLLQPRYQSLLDTGRTSAGGGPFGKKTANGVNIVNGTNVQNLRREPGVRECIVPRAGKAFVQRDYAMLELHTFAQTCRDLLGSSTLGISLNAGRDVHSEMAARMLGLPYETVYAGRKTIYADDRQAAKAVNFGLPGMLGARALVVYAKVAYGATITLDEAFEWVRIWHVMNPEARDYFELVSHWTGRGALGSITLMRSGRTRGMCSGPAGANYGFQGPAADLAKDAGWEISRECYVVPSSPLYGSRVPLFVHDEFILESPIERVHDVDARLKVLMEEAGARWCPDYPPRSEGLAMAYWSKNAERVEKGDRLVVWGA
jgi:hypothetical protein